VFPSSGKNTQAILTVWEENGPCGTAGKRLADHRENPDLTREFRAKAKGKRGVMGFVLSNGLVSLGDEVLVYPPAHLSA
jgi:MOSC domain-containing protein YiiM